MSNLEKLSLYLCIIDRDEFIGNVHLENEILVYMPQLHTFNFYIRTYIETVDIINNLSIEHIRQQHIACVINNIYSTQSVCSIFSIPFTFDRLEDIGNQFPDITFTYVTYLRVQDVFPFNRRFFMRVAQAFPLVKTFRISNYNSHSVCDFDDNNQSYGIAKYPHLTYLHVLGAPKNCLEQFLNERKTYVPCLTKLKVFHNYLSIVTNHFTREETRRNCVKIKRLLLVIPLVHSKDFCLYFLFV